MTERQLSGSDLHIQPTEIYEAMGYGTTCPDEETMKESAELMQRITAVIHPSLAFFITEGELNQEAETLTVNSTVFHIGKIIARQLRGSEAFAFFVATAGQAFEDLQHILKQEDDMVKIFMADSIGSILAEKTADEMELALEEQLAPQGWKHTNRFSPGYCGWHVSEQQAFFSLFPEEHPCGIHLTASSLMIPIKSVSGIIGVGENVRKLEYSCGLCDYEKCFRRKKKC